MPLGHPVDLLQCLVQLLARPQHLVQLLPQLQPLVQLLPRLQPLVQLLPLLRHLVQLLPRLQPLVQLLPRLQLLVQLLAQLQPLESLLLVNLHSVRPRCPPLPRSPRLHNRRQPLVNPRKLRLHFLNLSNRLRLVKLPSRNRRLSSQPRVPLALEPVAVPLESSLHLVQQQQQPSHLLSLPETLLLGAAGPFRPSQASLLPLAPIKRPPVALLRQLQGLHLDNLCLGKQLILLHRNSVTQHLFKVRRPLHSERLRRLGRLHSGSLVHFLRLLRARTNQGLYLVLARLRRSAPFQAPTKHLRHFPPNHKANPLLLSVPHPSQRLCSVIFRNQHSIPLPNPPKFNRHQPNPRRVPQTFP
jgi:hypothetical protein